MNTFDLLDLASDEHVAFPKRTAKTIYMPKDMVAAVKYTAERERRSFSSQVQHYIARCLIEDGVELDKRYAEVVNGGV